MTEDTDTLTNQTLFSNQEPLLQRNQPSFNMPVEEKTPEQLAAQKKKKTMVIVAGVGSGLFVLLLILVVALSPKSPILTIKPTPTPSPTVQAQKTQFQVRLEELSDDLNQADPSKLNLIVPPVNMELSLDPLPRNQN